jgi:hypothetical protein
MILANFPGGFRAKSRLGFGLAFRLSSRLGFGLAFGVGFGVGFGLGFSLTLFENFLAKLISTINCIIFDFLQIFSHALGQGLDPGIFFPDCHPLAPFPGKYLGPFPHLPASPGSFGIKPRKTPCPDPPFRRQRHACPCARRAWRGQGPDEAFRSSGTTSAIPQASQAPCAIPCRTHASWAPHEYALAYPGSTPKAPGNERELA